MFKDIKTVFIDLDDSIWDFSANSKVAMRKVYDKYGLEAQCPYERFMSCYMEHNARLWDLYHHGKITKEFLKSERFRISFEECGITFDDPELPVRFDYDYLETIVTCEKVVEGAHELLQFLKERWDVNVLSNGFKNLQYRKLQSGGLDKYISQLVLSDDIGVTKPDKRFFDYALEVVKGEPSTTLMIGDNYDADILGAHNAGWKTIFLNRKDECRDMPAADATVGTLLEIKNIL